ncbi:MAG: Membrane protein [Labilithrix sp.]|nr:Membrane protein [Labilithrix sp.]
MPALPSLETVALVAASYAFRLPALLNARSTNSDAAVVGLQAIHMLRGELSPFLWGSGYQTSADAVVAAVFFRFLGATPLVLMLSALTLHVVSTYLAFTMVRRRLAPLAALLVVMPLVVSPSSVHSYALYPPRQLSLTLAMAAFAALDAAGARRDEGRWNEGFIAAGGLLATLAVSADPYPMLLFPLLALYAAIVAWPRLVGLGGFLGGAAIGILPFFVMHSLPAAKSGPLTFTLGMIPHHVRLLLDECLPWALSYKVYYAHHVMDYAPWDAPLWFRVLGPTSAVLLALLVLVGLASALPFAARWLPAPVRQLGFVGALVFPLAIGAFLVSVMAMDHFSMRYLAVLTLLTPFAVMPAAKALGTRRFALLFVPHLAASAVAGWVGYGPFVHGPLPVRETPELRDDLALRDLLRADGLRWATADYWTSYRLTFLFGEEIVVVPTNPAEDRYPPYRRAFSEAPEFAYVFDPDRSREDLAVAEARLAQENARVERIAAGRLTVLRVTRNSR